MEVMLHSPSMEIKFYPWRNGKEFRQDSLKYGRLATVQVITRDKTSGTVTYYSANPFLPIINYSSNKYDTDALREGSIGAANICYIQGAKRIITSDGRIRYFENNKPTAKRSIDHPDYQSWVAEVRKDNFEALRAPYGSAHQMGTGQMSDFGPGYGAVDGKGHLYECKMCL
jgi:long-chain-alcohol oxidase